LLHNHKSRENFKQTLTTTTPLTVKDSKKFLIINNEKANICIWFSFIQDKQSFVKNLISFCTKLRYLKEENQEELEQEEEQPLQEDDDYFDQDPEVEMKDQNLAKLLQIPESRNHEEGVKTNLIQLIKDPQPHQDRPNHSILHFLSPSPPHAPPQPQAQPQTRTQTQPQPQTQIANDDDFFANMRQKHFGTKVPQITEPHHPGKSTSQRTNLASNLVNFNSQDNVSEGSQSESKDASTMT
jgi:hypothetical protein